MIGGNVLKLAVKTFNRLPREKISEDHFRLVGDITGDYIIKEYYDEDHLEDVEINITQILGMDLSDSSRYQVFQYGQTKFRKETSHFKDLKKQDFANRKCDISIIIVDHVDKKIYLVCAEVKKTLRIESLYEARQQMISTYIDLGILNSIVTHNIYPIYRIFFTVSERINIPQKELSSHQLLLKDKDGKIIPSQLLWTEFKNGQFYYALDLPSDMARVNKNLNSLVDWPSSEIQYKIV